MNTLEQNLREALGHGDDGETVERESERTKATVGFLELPAAHVADQKPEQGDKPTPQAEPRVHTVVSSSAFGQGSDPAKQDSPESGENVDWVQQINRDLVSAANTGDMEGIQAALDLLCKVQPGLLICVAAEFEQACQWLVTLFQYICCGRTECILISRRLVV